jgi:putative addiction module component (TIGR02574 family)
MKKSTFPISRLSFEQKLDLMETLWTDLVRDEKKLESPAWHKAVLRERSEADAAGKATASDWEQAKKRIKKKVSYI